MGAGSQAGVCRRCTLTSCALPAGLTRRPRSSTRTKGARSRTVANLKQDIDAVGGRAGAAGVYGTPHADVLPPPIDAIQFSPLIPGASELEQQGEGTLAS